MSTLVLGAGRTAADSVRVYRLLDPKTGASYEHAAPTLRFGAHPSNELVLDAEGVSRIHGEIIADAHGFRLRDLGSTNGLIVDGVRVLDAYLRPGARIVIGRAERVFEPQATEAKVPLATESRFGPLVGRSAAMRELFFSLAKVAKSDATVLIQGESGTGKEVIAEALHAESKRSGGPLVVFDCSAVSASLLEAELFGHEKGAFTGAVGAREGCLEAADGGTVFLDEIGELPLELQPKLLRALEKREIRRVGSTKTQKIDVRFVAATHRDLASEVNKGAFREDLFYRLAVVRLKSPPLRERTEDIPLLVEHFVRKLVSDEREIEEVMASLDASAWKKLAALPWRGNVRELRNFVERRLALGEGVTEQTGPSGSPSTSTKSEAIVDTARPFIAQRDEVLARFERAYLEAMLAEHEGNYSRAAAAAGIDRMYFKRLAKKHLGA